MLTLRRLGGTPSAASPKMRMWPGGRLLEAGDQPQAGGLARARGPEHGEERALGDLEVDAVDGAHGAEVARDVLELDGERPRAPSGRQRPPITPM